MAQFGVVTYGSAVFSAAGSASRAPTTPTAATSYQNFWKSLRAAKARPASARYCSASGPVITWIAFQAASLCVLVVEMPKPEPALTVMLPASRTGTGAMPTVKLAFFLMFSSCQGPSTYMATLPEVKRPLAIEEDCTPLAGSNGATLSWLTSAVYCVNALFMPGLARSSWPLVSR